MRKSAHPPPGTNRDQPTPVHTQSTAQASIIEKFFPAVLVILIVLFAWNPVDGASDIFSHAAVGRWIWDHRAVPRHTLFLWSFQRDWVAHSWLSEVALYVLMRSGESTGIAAATTIMIVLVAGAFMIAWRERSACGLCLPLLFFCGVLAASLRYQPRPEMFTDFFTAVVLAMLVRVRDIGVSDIPGRESAPGRRAMPRREIGMVFLLFAAWTNLHGAVIIGLILIAARLLGDLVQFRFDAGSRRTLAILAAASAGMLINPYGFHYFSIYHQVNSSVFHDIEEWFPPLRAPIVDASILASAMLLAIAAAGVLGADSKRPTDDAAAAQSTVAELLWLVYGVASFFAARRNVLELVIIALFITARHATSLTRLERRLASGIKLSAENGGLSAALPAIGQVLVIIVVAVHAPLITRPRPFDLMPSRALPTGQVAYIDRHNISGPVFNDYNTAAYLEWRLYGRCTFFIDSMNAYGDQILAPEAHVLLDDAIGASYLDEHGIGCVIGRAKDPSEPDYPPMYYRLTHDPRWSLVYFDVDGPIWLRR